MKRHTPVVALALVALSPLLGDPGAARGGADAAVSVPTGRFTVTVPASRADSAAIAEDVAREIAGARLAGVRRVLVRGGPGASFVFEMPAGPRAVKRPDLDRALRRLGRAVDADCAEERRKWAKGKPVNLPIFESDWNGRNVRTQPALELTSAPAAQAKATGKGQIVAVLDGGFDLTHEFLAGHLAEDRYDAVDDDGDPHDIGNGTDDDAEYETPDAAVADRIVGHGTFVASVILAVAPGATILPVRILDDEGWGTDLAVASGIAYAMEHGARVINMSLVVPDATPIVRDAVRAAFDAGVVVVTASGSTDDSLQNDVSVTRRSICVGATDRDDVVAEWSITGSFVHVFAPGVDVCGAIGGSRPGSYGRWSGVSFAVPFLSAGAAMLREKHPFDWSARDVRNRLVLPSAPAWFPSGEHVLWRGRLDLDRAVLWY